MLKELRLKNIVLIEATEITFTSGFNVLSGESGSGKSAILNALNLIAGDRSDPNLVRRGAEKGVIEAIFDIDKIPLLSDILEQAGIDHESGNELLIRRELFTTGKSRAFVNNQTAQLGLLKKITDCLFEIVGQHANQKLLSLDNHRKILDTYGDLQEEVLAFSKSWEEEIKIREQLDHLIHSEAQRFREMEVCQMEIEELQEANLKEGEEEELFKEYTQLSNSEELTQKIEEIIKTLSGEKIGVLTHLTRQKSLFEHLIKLDASFNEMAQSYQNALIELQEVTHSLRNYASRIESDPERVHKLNERLSLITKLKRKYGSNVQEIQNYLSKTKERLHFLENADASLDLLKEKLDHLSEKSNSLGTLLTARRQEIAKELEKAAILHLQELNMPKVKFVVDISKQKRTRFGDDKIEFFITPNLGEKCISLKDCASGGELSRIMLSLQALLAGKEQIPCIIFDEIDSNIGGETATIVGEKLREIGRRHQVLCITHFPQVAKLAKHHLMIEKKEIEGRTLTFVTNLDDKSRKQELTRMSGGIKEIYNKN